MQHSTFVDDLIQSMGSQIEKTVWHLLMVNKGNIFKYIISGFIQKILDYE